MAAPPKELSNGFEAWAKQNPLPDLPPGATSDDVYKAAGFTEWYTVNPDETPGAKVFLPVDSDVTKS